jgi:hypothetical protein
MCPPSDTEYGDDNGLRENPVRVRVVVELTDPYYTDQDNLDGTIKDALANDFDEVYVLDVDRVDAEVQGSALTGDTDPSTGIVHYPGVDD